MKKFSFIFLKIAPVVLINLSAQVCAMEKYDPLEDDFYVDPKTAGDLSARFNPFSSNPFSPSPRPEDTSQEHYSPTPRTPRTPLRHALSRSEGAGSPRYTRGESPRTSMTVTPRSSLFRSSGGITQNSNNVRANTPTQEISSLPEGFQLALPPLQSAETPQQSIDELLQTVRDIQSEDTDSELGGPITSRSKRQSSRSGPSEDRQDRVRSLESVNLSKGIPNARIKMVLPESFLDWAAKEKGRIELFLANRIKKLKAEEHYQKVCQEARAAFGNLEVPIELLVAVERLQTQAIQNAQTTKRDYRRVFEGIEDNFDGKEISLGDAVRVREQFEDRERTRAIRDLLDLLYKALDEDATEREYERLKGLFQKKLQQLADSILPTQTYRDFLESLTKPAKGNLESVSDPKASNEAMYQHFIAFEEYLRKNPSEDQALVQFPLVMRELTPTHVLFAKAKHAHEKAHDAARLGAVGEDVNQSVRDLIEKKRQELTGLLGPIDLELGHVLTVYDIYRFNHNQAKMTMISKVLKVKREADQAAAQVESLDWYKDQLQKEFKDSTDANIRAAIQNPEPLIQKARGLLGERNGAFDKRILVVRGAHEALQLAAREFLEIEHKCMMQHVLRGILTRNDQDGEVQYQFVPEGLENQEIFLTQEELNASFLFESEDKKSVVLKRSPEKLLEYLCNFENQLLRKKRDNPFHTKPEQPVKAFEITDMMDLRITINRLQMYLIFHLERESQIFQRIITVDTSDYKPSVSGWGKGEAWVNTFYASPFKVLQLNQLISVFPPFDIKKEKQFSKKEEVKPVLADAGDDETLDQHQAEICEAKRSVQEEKLRAEFKACGNRFSTICGLPQEEHDAEKQEQFDATVDSKYRAHRNLTGVERPFQKRYQGYDQGVVRSSTLSETMTKREVGAQKIVHKTTFSFPLETRMLVPSRRLYKKAEACRLTNFLPPKGVKMAVEYRDFSMVRAHRELWNDVVEELQYNSPELRSSFQDARVLSELEELYKAQLTHWKLLGKKWVVPVRHERPKHENDQKEVYRRLFKIYEAVVTRETEQLNILEPPQGWVGSFLSKLTWIKPSFAFFFIEDPEPTVKLPDMTHLDLSCLNMHDNDLTLKHHVPSAKPGVFENGYVLCGFESLNLSQNALQKPPAHVFTLGLMQSLVELDISENQLDTLVWMKNLRQLRRANLSNNPEIKTLSVFGPFGMNALRSLEELNIANIGLTCKADIEALTGFTGLTLLDISANIIKRGEMEPVLFNCLPQNLRVLIAADCQLVGHWSTFFPPMGLLAELNVEGNDGLEIVPAKAQKDDASWIENARKFNQSFPKMVKLHVHENQTIELVEGIFSLDSLADGALEAIDLSE